MRQPKKDSKNQQQLPLNQIHKEQQTAFHKLCIFIKKLLIGDPKLQSALNCAILASTYFQLLELVNIILLFTYFQSTNSQLYSILMTVFIMILFLVDTIPKISKKYYIVFNFVMISTGLIIIVLIGLFKLIADNMLLFTFICDQFKGYFVETEQQTIARVSANMAAINKEDTLNMCQNIIEKFWIQLAFQAAFVFIKIIHFGMYIHAYRVAKANHEDLERRRRRKDRYNLMIRRKIVWDENRKV